MDYRYDLIDDKFHCKECVKIYNTIQALASHYAKIHDEVVRSRLAENYKNSLERRRATMAARKKLYPNKYVSWNKGLTKDTDQRVAKTTQSMKQFYANGGTAWSKGLSKETDSRLQKLSNNVSVTVNKKVADGDWHMSYPATQTYQYKNIKFRGKWELNFAIWLDSYQVEWIRPSIGHEYIFEGKLRRYFPDFYLPQFDLYIEIKGCTTKKDIAKWNQFKYKFLVIRGEFLKELDIVDSYTPDAYPPYQFYNFQGLHICRSITRG